MKSLIVVYNRDLGLVGELYQVGSGRGKHAIHNCKHALNNLTVIFHSDLRDFARLIEGLFNIHIMSNRSFMDTRSAW